MKPLAFALLLFSLFTLLSCDSSPNKPATTAHRTSPEVIDDSNAREESTADPSLYANIPLRVIAVHEQQLQAINVIEVKLSTPISDRNISSSIHIEPSAGEPVLSPNGMSVQYRDVAPDQKYQYHIDTTLRALNGSRLSEEHRGEFTSQPLPASVRFDVNGAIVNLRSIDRVNVHSVNVTAADVNLYRVKDDALVQFFGDIDGFTNASSRYFSDSERQAALEHIITQRIELPSAGNTRHEVGLSLPGLSSFNREGVYFLTIGAPGDFAFSSAMWISVSHIGLQLRNYGDRVELFTQNIDGGAPLKDVRVERYNYNGKLEKTVFSDQFGHATFLDSDGRGSYFVAYHENASSVIRRYRNSYDLSAQMGSFSTHQAHNHYVYQPRDLYRPGETVYFSMLAKDYDGNPLLGKQLIKIFDAKGNVYNSFSARPSDMGYLQFNFELPENATTGNWGIRVDGGANTSYVNFQVEEFLPETLEMSWNSDQVAALWALPESLAIPITGRYLYGAPADRNRLSSTAVIQPTTSPFGTSDYLFGNTDMGRRYIDFEDITLDEAGAGTAQFTPQLLVNSNIDLEQLNSPAEMNLSYSLFEASGRSIDRQYRLVIWPRPFFVGIDPLFDRGRVAENSLARFALARFDQSGAITTQGTASVQLIREERTGYWSHTDQRGWQYISEDNEYLMIDTEHNFSDESTIELPVEWGVYRLEVTDESGGLTRVRFQAGSDWYNRWMAQSSQVDPESVSISLAGESFRAGSHFQAQITSPIRGTGLWVLESDRVLAKGYFEIDETDTLINVEMPEDIDRHDLYLSAFIVSPEGDFDRVRKRAFGLQHVPLDRSQEQLEIAIESAENWLPDQRHEVVIHVKDRNDQPYSGQANVTLSAVDIGALSLTNYQIGDPFTALFGQRRYGAQSVSDIYGFVLEPSALEAAPVKWGGDLMQAMDAQQLNDDESLRGAERAKASPTIVTWFSGPVQVVDGRAMVSVEVPDFNGALLLTALGFGERAVGLAQQRVTVSSPVVVEFAQPRFLAPGDRLEGIIDIRNLNHSDNQFKLSVSLTDPLTTTDDGHQLTIEQGKNQRITVPIDVADTGGTGTVNVTLNSGDLVIEKSWSIATRPIENRRFNFSQQLLKPGESRSFPVELLANLRGDNPLGWLQVSAMPDFNQQENWQSLSQYPYACLEQTTSRLRPWLAASSAQLRNLGGSEASRDQMISDSLARYRELQHPSGGFKLWPSAASESPWLTVYVADTLLQLRSRGTEVATELLDPAVERLRFYTLRRQRIEPLGYTDNPNALDGAVKSYAAFVLAREGLLALGPVRDIFNRQADQLRSPLSIVHLALALQLSGDTQAASDFLASKLVTSQRPETYLGDYGSALRDQAAAYRLLRQYQLLDTIDSNAIFTSLLNSYDDSQWLNTQERSQLLELSLSHPIAASWQADVSGVAGISSIDGRTPQRWSLSDEFSAVALTNTSSSPLFVSYAASGYPTPQSLAQDPVKVGLRYFLIDGADYVEIRSGQSIPSGSLIYARLTAWSNASIHDAMMVSLLPAGFELINPRLPNSPTLDDLGVEQLAAGNNLYPEHEEFRDDRYVSTFDLRSDREIQTGYLMRATTPGRFQVPSTLIESMYQPHIREEIRPLVDLVISGQ